MQECWKVHYLRRGSQRANSQVGLFTGIHEAGVGSKPSSGDDTVSLNDIMAMACPCSMSSTSVTDEHVAVWRERRKRMERCLSNLPRSDSETSVVSTALPWSMRMMIRLNAMPCRGDIGCLSTAGRRHVRR